MSDAHPHITGKAVLVTGAAGSIGSVLCERILALRPAKLVMVNLTEAGLVALERRLRTGPVLGETDLHFVLGDVKEEALLERWLTGIYTLIHAAAYKFVPACESNPSAAVLNNVGSMLALCDTAQQAQVQRCLLVSTDKAVNPASAMGATKAIAERLISGFGPGFLTVRFGNVLDSSGSVLPLWREQIAHGGPVTVTHPDCTRYFMALDEACLLVLETLALDVSYGTFVFDMGEPRNMLQMAEQLIAESGTACEIAITGLRPGDKLTEEVYEGDRQPTTHPRIYQVASAAPLEARATPLVMLLDTARRYDDEGTRQRLWRLVEGKERVLAALAGPELADMLTFVTWKWKGTDPARHFASEHVNVLYAMLGRHYHASFRLICLTDDPSGLDTAIEAIPLPETKADSLPAPRQGQSKKFPACYRRLWLFSQEATALGRRICQVDIDVLILEDITAMLQRKTADFVGWVDQKSFAWNKIAGGLWLLTPGKYPEVWEDFNPDFSPTMAHNAGFHGSDQAWLSYKLYPPEQSLTQKDGVMKLGWLVKGGHHPPAGVKMVFTSGVKPPWDHALQLGYPWIKSHWKL
jgi:nucleoside-diphosphate-sugar epimerase